MITQSGGFKGGKNRAVLGKSFISKRGGNCRIEQIVTYYKQCEAGKFAYFGDKLALEGQVIFKISDAWANERPGNNRIPSSLQ